MKTKTVFKRTGEQVPFDKNKIYIAIIKSMKQGSGIFKDDIARTIAEEIEKEVERQKADKKSQVESQKEFKKSISTFVSESTEIKGMPLNKKDSQELPDYISNPTIKLQDGRQITPFYRDLFESFKDKEKLVLLAKLVKNEFDFSDIKKEVATKQTREIKNEFQRQKKNQPKEAHIPKRLVDLI